MKAPCISSDSRRIISLKDAGAKSKIEIINDSQKILEIHKVDGCLITVGIRCDWKLVDAETGREIYVELKGSDVEHAVKQIVRSVDILSASREIKSAYIVCSRSPLASSQIQVLQKSLLRSKNIRLRIKKTVCSETVEAMLS